ncbi:MAG: acyl-CoA dehydratase activase-related protein [Candidatus Gracilibacteria bacterium]
MVIIDAGVEHITLFDPERNVRITADTNSFKLPDDAKDKDEVPYFIAGKLSENVKETLCTGIEISTEAALWQSAIDLIGNSENSELNSLGIIELSASGYIVLAVNKNGNLKDGLLLTNPHCGAGSGLNLNRILQKLDIAPDKVDEVLKDYIGKTNQGKRSNILIRSDRCGVFSSSATVSDKNQGIPLDYALATTIKSEVLKACKKMSNNTDKVYLTGGVFRWQFARDCAEDYLISIGIQEVSYDYEQSFVLNGVRSLSDKVGHENFRKPNKKLSKEKHLPKYPSFKSLLDTYTQDDRYLRSPDNVLSGISEETGKTPIKIALDVGSTMAKIAISYAITGKILFLESYSNNGDTIQIIQHIFQKIKDHNIENLNIQHIGITGSGRHQVQTVLGEIWPHLSQQGRIETLVENYAHARGSIDEAKVLIEELKGKGHEVNEDYFAVVDVGGEDTKITLVSLKEGDLADNAMNLKCSAGTGSLMDILKSLFGIKDIKEACDSAMSALQGYNIDATCAVLLMENAQKMRAAGYPIEEILASCYWAIVENMARTLWSQIKLPPKTLVLMHGQTMLSDPLPLAIMSRIQTHTNSKMYGLVPPNPGHRGCIGLLRNSASEKTPIINDLCNLDDLINKKFEREVVTCRGKACGNGGTSCALTVLSFKGAENQSCHATVGGCLSVNESKRTSIENLPKGYKDIRKIYKEKLPQSDDPKRVIIPRSFAVSEEAYFLSQIFENLGIPVHVDDVKSEDVFRGQPRFNVDTCAPNIGATGQFLRLAEEPHGAILAPQIDFLPTEGKSTGRTCLNEQAGIAIAMHFAKSENPNAKFNCFDLSLQKLDPIRIAAQLYAPFGKIFKDLGRDISREEFLNAIKDALEKRQRLNDEIAEKAAKYIEEANSKGERIVIVCGREHILTPGIYDSHASRLFRDKGLFTIPADIIEVALAEEFKDVYWKNQHQLLTIVQAVRDKKLHTIVKNPNLAKALEKADLSLSFISAFQCGPDSVTLPLVMEMMKNEPTLTIQSDAAINQLAHLESRVDTYFRQLQRKVMETKNEESEFEMAFLDDLEASDLNPKTDVIYFHTMGDNRTVSAVMRAAGFTCIDNYSDETYNLSEKVTTGRQHLGDSACLAMVAIYADALKALEDFTEKKKKNETSLKGKKRVLFYCGKFNNPCRQGRYHDLYRLDMAGILKDSRGDGIDFSFLRGEGKNKLKPIVQEWVLIQIFHSVVAKDVLDSIYLKGGANCGSQEEYEQFLKEFLELKEEVVHVFESIKPSRLADGLDKVTSRIKALQMAIRYFSYGIYNNNGLRKKLSDFSNKWIQRKETDQRKIKIHIDGEFYMRVSQAQEIFKAIVDSIGFGSFDLTHTPVFSLLEYMMEERKMIAEDKIRAIEEMEGFNIDPQERGKLEKTKRKRQKEIQSCEMIVKMVRRMLIEPLYKAAAIKTPESMEETLDTAKIILPTRKPRGEIPHFVGDALSHLKGDTDLVINVGADNCLSTVASDSLTDSILMNSGRKGNNILNLLSHDGTVNIAAIRRALLKVLGPVDYYQSSYGGR